GDTGRGALAPHPAGKRGLEGCGSKRVAGRYGSGRPPDWINMNTRTPPAVKREAKRTGANRDGDPVNCPSTAPAPTARLAGVFSLPPRRRGARRQPLFASALFGVSLTGGAFLAALRPLSALRCIVHAGKTPTHERPFP